MILLHVTLSIFLISSVWAQSCPTKNLMTEKDSPFDQIPVYNQDGSGTCYAYTASQLANYYLLKKGETKTLEYHPLWVALQYANSYKGKTITGGVADIALDEISVNSYCSYSSVSKSLQIMAREQNMTDHEIIGFIEQLSHEYTTLLKENDMLLPGTGGNTGGPKITSHPNKVYKLDRPIVKVETPPKKPEKKDKPFVIPMEYPKAVIDNLYVKKNFLPKDLENYKPSIDQIKKWAINNTIKETKNFVTCSESSLKKLAENLIPLMNVANTAMFRKLLLDDCAPKKGRNLPVSHVYSPSNANDNDYKKLLRNHFAKKSQPLGIRYCSEVLKNPNLDAIKDDPAKSRVDNRVGKCGSHASMLVASRPSGKSCEYLLRNTWGAGYGSWTKNWKCACKDKKTGSYFNDCSKDSHPVNKYEVVGCWIPESKIIKNLYGTQWLE
jgi:hypothetical protein